MNEIQVDGALLVPKAEESLPGPEPGLTQEPSQDLKPEIPASQAANPVALGPVWLRLAYAFEFLIALLAILSLWSEIGGEGHLDLMPWHVKLVCILGLAWCSVRFTASIVEHRQFWTARTVAWFLGVILFCIVMGGITYYYHLHEETGEGDDDTSAAAMDFAGRSGFVL